VSGIRLLGAAAATLAAIYALAAAWAGYAEVGVVIMLAGFRICG
jgi:hypothetical protein